MNLLAAVQEIRGKLPEIAGANWHELDNELVELLKQLEIGGASQDQIKENILRIFAKYPIAHARWNELTIELEQEQPKVFGSSKEAGHEFEKSVSEDIVLSAGAKKPPSVYKSMKNVGSESERFITEHTRQAHDKEPRYVNVCITASQNRKALTSKTSLKAKKEYFLRLDIGALSRDSVVENPQGFPSENLPRTQEGHWLEVVVISNEFIVPNLRHDLFLPNTGASWVCNCRPGSYHTCGEEGRNTYLYIKIRTVEELGTARLRINVYYANNLVQSQLLTAEIVSKGQIGSGYSSRIDYTLTAQLRDVSFLTSRALNILTNESTDGSHTLVINNGSGGVISFHFTEAQMCKAIADARTQLEKVHFREIRQPGTLGRRTNLYDKNNSKKRDDFIKDLKNLAYAGWKLWASLFQHTSSEDGDRLRNLIKPSAEMTEASVTIQVARTMNSTFVFPWALLYDIYISSDSSKYKICRILEDWDQQGCSSQEVTSRCPYEADHMENTICPFGFWGFKYIIEQPGSTSDMNLAKEINVSKPLEMVVCESLELDTKLTKAHLDKIRGQFPYFKVIEADSCAGIFANLSKEIELVYFYCHGRRDESSGDVYLEVGKDDKIAPSDITGWGLNWSVKHWQTTPLVFINGCHTVEYTPESLVNFVDAFAKVKASGVIGTEITLDQGLANEAAEQLLDNFRHKMTVGQALQRMRFHLLQKNNLLGLAYTAYCSTDLKLVDVNN